MLSVFSSLIWNRIICFCVLYFLFIYVQNLAKVIDLSQYKLLYIQLKCFKNFCDSFARVKFSIQPLAFKGLEIFWYSNDNKHTILFNLVWFYQFNSIKCESFSRLIYHNQLKENEKKKYERYKRNVLKLFNYSGLPLRRTNGFKGFFIWKRKILKKESMWKNNR